MHEDHEEGALIDVGGDLDKVRAGVAKAGVTIEKLLVTHGHMDHCGAAALAANWASRSKVRTRTTDTGSTGWRIPGRQYRMPAENFVPDRLAQGW